MAAKTTTLSSSLTMTVVAGTVAAMALGLLAVPATSAGATDELPSTPVAPLPAPAVEPLPSSPSSMDTPVSQWPMLMTLGTSARGRSIVAQRQGNATAPRILLAVGMIHGNEKAGRRIVNQVRKYPLPAPDDVQIWTIQTMNPDGAATSKRRNARQVDLNRNFPTGWSRKTTGAGTAPGSEPETQALMRFMTALRPDATFVYHQDWNVVLGACNMKTRSYALRYAKLTGLKREACGRASYTGTMGSWYNANFPGYLLTVELPGSRKVTAKKVRKWRTSVFTAARELPDIDQTPVDPVIEPSLDPAP